MKRENLSKVLEFFWLLLSGLSLGAGIHKCINTSIKEGWTLFLISFIAAGMFLMRRKLRLKNKADKKDK